MVSQNRRHYSGNLTWFHPVTYSPGRSGHVLQGPHCISSGYGEVEQVNAIQIFVQLPVRGALSIGRCTGTVWHEQRGRIWQYIPHQAFWTKIELLLLPFSGHSNCVLQCHAYTRIFHSVRYSDILGHEKYLDNFICCSTCYSS